MAQQQKIIKELLPLSPLIQNHFESNLKDLTERWKERKKVPASLLFSGPKGSSKRSLIHQLSLWLLCQNNPLNLEETPSLFGDSNPLLPNKASPCLECTSCKAGLRNEWIDFKEILPEFDGEKTSPIKIEAIRDLKEKLGYSAYQGKYKITFIHQAELLTTQAANALLKLLEEPPPGWILFLSTNDTGLILPTLLSRCQRIRVLPFKQELIDQYLRDKNVQKQTLFAKLSLGSLDRAQVYSSEEFQEIRDTLFKWISQIKVRSQEQSTLLDWMTKKDENTEILLDIYETLALDLLQLTNLSSETLLNSDFKTFLIPFFSTQIKLKTDKLSQWTDDLSVFRQRLKSPVNRKLLAQEILFSWCKLET